MAQIIWIYIRPNYPHINLLDNLFVNDQLLSEKNIHAPAKRQTVLNRIRRLLKKQCDLVYSGCQDLYYLIRDFVSESNVYGAFQFLCKSRSSWKKYLFVNKHICWINNILDARVYFALAKGSAVMLLPDISHYQNVRRYATPRWMCHMQNIGACTDFGHPLQTKTRKFRHTSWAGYQFRKHVFYT